MTDLERAVIDASRVLKGLGVPHMLVGGLAVSRWQEPRATVDADFSIWVEPENRAGIAQALLTEFSTAVGDPFAFLDKTNVLPLVTSSGVRIDLIFASLPMERRMLDRSSEQVVAGTYVPVVSLEDLVFMKLISERPKDTDDAVRLVRRHRKSIDGQYLTPLLEEMANALDRPDILKLYKDALD